MMFNSPNSDGALTQDESESTNATTPNTPFETPASRQGDVAVIGLGCRVAGGINSHSQLWDFLLAKGDASGEIPPMRWEPYFRRARNANVLSKTTAKGYFLERLEDFDASFFGISPREAEQIDPQQRISVEVAWEALEDAGIPPQSLAGSDTAVFMGVNSDDYSRLLLEDLPRVEAWMGVGSAFCGIPNRISYLLDLMGPSSAVDAACASSLVAIHHARQALIADETSLAIAGGVNALAAPGLTRVLDEAGALSSDGRCRSFDDSASGYGRGEGVGIVILKRMEDALRDHDRIYAVLRGSAVAADGRTNGIMAPNSVAQEKVARQALKAAQVTAASLSYVEAHATSTPIGDPTECSALANVYGFGARQPGDEPCLVGSIKPNIGHLEAGAGVLGFIKAVKAVHTGIIPPQANLETLNTKVNWKESMLKVVTERTEWPANGKPRRAAIASYGYGGTVSHAVIEAAIPLSLDQLSSDLQQSPKPTLLLLSVLQESRMNSAAKNLAAWLQSAGHRHDLDSLAFTLGTRRGHHPYRAAIVAGDHCEATSMFNALSERVEAPWLYSSRALPKNANAGTVWVFSGHGAQWKTMGQALAECEPGFMNLLYMLEPTIQEELGFSIIDAIENEDLEATDKVQVLTYVMHIGIANALKNRGALPKAIIGHSVGEIAAAVTAGALSIREGALITCKRARLFQSVAGAGAMALIDIPYEEAIKELKDQEDIVVAIDSSPSSCVVSGKVEVVKQFSAAWKSRGVRVRAVNSDVAFHSPVLSHLATPLLQQLEGVLEAKRPEIPLYSTSLPLDPRGKDARDAKYWVNNMLKPVLLTSAVSAAAEDGFRIFLEVSSHPIVSHSIAETLSEANVADAVVIPTLRRGKPIDKSLLLALGKTHCAGGTIDFQKLFSGSFVPDIPGTLWEHRPYWRTVESGSSNEKDSHDVRLHVLLGKRTQVFGGDSVIWQTYLDDTVKPFPGSHFLHDSEIVPAAVLLNTFHQATSSQSLQDVALRVPVVVSPPREVQVFLQHDRISISSRLIVAKENDKHTNDHSWLTNTTARVSRTEEQFTTRNLVLAEIKERLRRPLKANFSVDYLAKVGVRDMGFPWKIIEHVENEMEMLAKVDLAPEAGSSLPWDKRSWAPVLDAATSVASTIFHQNPRLRMPAHIDQVIFGANISIRRINYIYVRKATTPFVANVTICDEGGSTMAEFRNMRFAEIEGAATNSVEGLVHRLAWPPAQLSETPTSFSNVLFLGNEGKLVRGYQEYLQNIGIETKTMSSLENLNDVKNAEDINGFMKDTIVIYVPDEAMSPDEVFPLSTNCCQILLDAVKMLGRLPRSPKLYCITQGVAKAQTFTALGQAPLHGLARIIQSEESDVWGGLVDVEDSAFPIMALKYVHGADVIRIQDFVPRTARLRPLPSEKVWGPDRQNSLHPSREGTYLITGGLGALGLEVAAWMVEKGARRIVLVSRRELPPRAEWRAHEDKEEIQKIAQLEAAGATIYPVSVDMAKSNSSVRLRRAIHSLFLPPVLGVVHAAGVIEDQLVTATTADSFNKVIAPKIAGAVALDELFPPRTLNFFVLFSSCGQLLGFPGQAAYASGNAFLDALAVRRRSLGDNAVSMLWTSWRGLGMAASTDYINAELAAKGITDITKEEAFQAWDRIAKYDIDHAVILRCLHIEEDALVPHYILNDLLMRPSGKSTSMADGSKTERKLPRSGPELAAHLVKEISACVGSILRLPADSMDNQMALSEMGMDSVMGVALRSKLENQLRIKTPPTLIWSQPTISHLVRYFAEKLSM